MGPKLRVLVSITSRKVFPLAVGISTSCLTLREDQMDSSHMQELSNATNIDREAMSNKINGDRSRKNTICEGS